MSFFKRIRGKVVWKHPEFELELQPDQEKALEAQEVKLPSEGASIAIGHGAQAEGGGIAIGKDARAGPGSVAIGEGAGNGGCGNAFIGRGAGGGDRRRG